MGVVGFLAIWELVACVGVVPQNLFPTVDVLLNALGGLMLDPSTWTAVGQTLARAVAGLAIAFGLAIAAALAAIAWRPLFLALEMLADVAQTLPPPALVPLLIFVLGLGPPMFLTIIAFSALWPLYTATSGGLATTEPVQLAVARAAGLSPAETVFRVRLPAAMPQIFTGLRVAMGFALMAAVASEMIAGSSGLGYQLFDYAFSLQTPQMYALLVIIGATGALLSALVQLLRRTLLAWHLGQMQRTRP